MFNCQHAPVMLARREAANKAEERLLSDNLPPAVVIAFMNMIRKATGLIDTDMIFECPHARKAMEAQASLGKNAVLRGHVHVEWFHAIEKTYRKRAYPPHYLTARRKDKPPIELCTTLVQAVWGFFEEVWATRNEHLHEGTGTKDPNLAAELTGRLLHYKQNAAALLHYGDRSWIERSNEEIDSWTNLRKRHMLRILDSWHRLYLAEQEARQGGQKCLLDFPGFTFGGGEET